MGAIRTVNENIMKSKGFPPSKLAYEKTVIFFKIGLWKDINFICRKQKWYVSLDILKHEMKTVNILPAYWQRSIIQEIWHQHFHALMIIPVSFKYNYFLGTVAQNDSCKKKWKLQIPVTTENETEKIFLSKNENFSFKNENFSFKKDLFCLRLIPPVSKKHALKTVDVVH